MGESSIRPLVWREHADLNFLVLARGGWFLALIAVPTIFSCWETLRVDLGLVARAGMFQRMSLTAEPFLLGALLGGGIMQLLCRRWREARS